MKTNHSVQINGFELGAPVLAPPTVHRNHAEPGPGNHVLAVVPANPERVGDVLHVRAPVHRQHGGVLLPNNVVARQLNGSVYDVTGLVDEGEKLGVVVIGWNLNLKYCKII